MTEFKSFSAEFKATGGTKAGEAGYVDAYVSMFGNVDYGGDRMVPGAFAKTLAEWKDSGDPIPAIWSHDWDNPDAHVGVVEDVIEDEKGLKVRMKFDLDRPFANQVFYLLKNRRVREFSFGYITREAEVVQDEELGEVREIRDVKLIEVGPTLVGMNPATQLLEAASLARRKAGRVLSGKNEESLKTARDLIDEVLTSAKPVDERAASITDEKAIENKAIEVPDYVAANAERGLRYYEDGLGGDGLVDATIEEARALARGEVTEAKVRKIGPWVARHLVDFDAPQNSDPDHEDYPGPGLVAHLLWGSGPDRAGAERTQAWAERESAALEESSIEPDSKSARDSHATIQPTERQLALLLKTRYREV